MTKTTEKFISFPDPDSLQIVTGHAGGKLEQLSKLLNLEVKLGSKGLTLIGDSLDVNLASEFLEQIKTVFVSNKLLTFRDVSKAFKALAADRNANLEEYFSSKIKIQGKKYAFFPKTAKQKEYLDAIADNDLVFGVGPAGTGKTFLAMAMAVTALLEKKVKRIILCRPAVEAGEKLGFLPGDLEEKINPYLRPLYDALNQLTDYDKSKELMEKGVIEVAPLAFMRGRTLSDAFVILDEAQNTTSSQMKMFLTRLGPNSKCVITGDISQVDLHPGDTSGMVEALKLLKNIKNIAIIELSVKDVIRHSLVADIIRAYDKK